MSVLVQRRIAEIHEGGCSRPPINNKGELESQPSAERDSGET